MNKFAKRTVRLGAILAASSSLWVLGCAAQAQQANPAPPVHLGIDQNGVDLVSGSWYGTSSSVSIGQLGAGGLERNDLSISSGFNDLRDNLTGTIAHSGSTYYVSLGSRTEKFTLSGSTFTPAQGQGSTLSLSGNLYTYTAADGTVAVFDTTLNSTTPNQADASITTLRNPTGVQLTYTYKSIPYCTSWSDPNTCATSIPGVRLQSVTSNLGYQIHYSYENDTETSNGYLLTGVIAINLAVDYCDPAADSCTNLSQSWPTLTFGNGALVTDALGRATKYSGTNSNFTITLPSGVAVSVTLDSSGRVASVTRGGSTWSYTYSTSGNTLTTTVTDPNGHTRVVASDQTLLEITSDTDGNGHTTTYAYDTYGRLIQATYPEGNAAQYQYDTRGNLIKTTLVAKPGSGLSNIVTSASYNTTCSNPVTCNKPNYTIDANGNETDYTYDPTHGGLLTVTLPAPTTGAVRPQIRYSYSQVSAWYKNSAGQLIQGAPIWRLTGVSTCGTGSAPSCVGTGDEVKTTIAYGASGVANNLLPTSVSKGSGDGLLTATTTATYDSVGNLYTVVGPLGSAYTTRYRYDADRELVGVVGPDPDGAGPLLNRARRFTYTNDGLVSLVEQGTVPSQSDSDWASFTSLQQVATTYNGNDEVAERTIQSADTVWSAIQYSYDAAGRLTCAAVRTNPLTFTSLPTSACTLATTGAFGPDRIASYSYDNADQLLAVVTGYGTSNQRTEVTKTYNPDGTVATLADGNGNLTTLKYDGFDRLADVYYPTPSNGSVSSTTDYEQYSYDSGSRLSQDRRRDGQTIAYTYDGLSRVTAVSLPATTFAYDNLGRRTLATYSGQTLTYAYDALSRLISEIQPMGAVSYQYDLAGERTRMTWPDGMYVSYGWDYAGELASIGENGATSGPGLLAQFSYDGLGRRTSLGRGNGLTTTYGFDSLSRLSSLTQNPMGTLSLTYSPMGQLVSRSVSNSAYQFGGQSAGTRAYGINGQNQITTSGSNNLSYDGRGNLSSDSVTTYSYDAANRLTGTSSGATLSYDAAGRLYQTTGSGASTQFLYDGSDLIAEYSGSNLLRRYVHGPGNDEPLVWYEGSGTTDRQWLLADERGSILAVTNSSGVAVGSPNTYDEYGVPGTGNQGRFQFTGQAWIPEVGLYYYKARMYSPTLGRFIQTDPIGYRDGMNWYGYVHGDPVNKTDPSGTITPVGVAIGAGFGFAAGFVSEAASGGSLLQDFEAGGIGAIGGGIMGALDPTDGLGVALILGGATGGGTDLATQVFVNHNSSIKWSEVAGSAAGGALFGVAGQRLNQLTKDFATTKLANAAWAVTENFFTLPSMFGGAVASSFDDDSSSQWFTFTGTRHGRGGILTVPKMSDEGPRVESADGVTSGESGWAPDISPPDTDVTIGPTPYTPPGGKPVVVPAPPPNSN